MPTRRKAITNHQPINYDKDLDAIETHVLALRDQLPALFSRWKLPRLEQDV